MRKSEQVTVVLPPLAPGEEEDRVPEPFLPPEGQLDGMEEFGTVRNWVSFDAPRGKLTCRSLGTEYEEFQAVIVESRVVRVMKDEDGNVFCASSDRICADTGRPGRECVGCEDRDGTCFPRWWIAWQDVETELLFAHTLSQTGSLNFNKYAGALLREGLSPGAVLTRIFAEDAHRHKTGTLYRRLQFAKLGGSA